MAAGTVGIRLDDEIQERLKRLGENRDRSPHYLMKKAVERYLEQEERVEEEKAIVQERWAVYEATGEAFTHDQFKSWAKSLRKAATKK